MALFPNVLVFSAIYTHFKTSPLLANQFHSLKRSSYYNPDYRAGAALNRARRPYLFKNLITGACIFSFAIGVFAFTLKAVGQDNFEDVVVPDAPAPAAAQQQQAPKAPNAQANGMRS
ncbi:hypothetical protein ABEF92_008305 [Exophiala dermatitidis]|uniref:Cytochrome c oxidase assembly factor 3 n=1 Tax=Exophiala dermatitidis (strain ATCC 34100 / CBS 525.76 / NIH/UT8656) TaxID=858893 RepID=H6C7R1_EXODN|nr:uncharacterized protein HMPREF1120_07686 [Exophiala dermatitidis NIH/UT8656]EHY59703.1 hypothetical protein HMPREF1120_07686 [Exophiala dermatitidis NIH/UT8656]KAJ4522539.1 hypothetical protein HRR75_000933 [Exophiala dermatitidis]KAJ4559506.1 hypothetical protein HRR78_000026 [Exophiala dermatitidis]